MEIQRFIYGHFRPRTGRHSQGEHRGGVNGEHGCLCSRRRRIATRPQPAHSTIRARCQDLSRAPRLSQVARGINSIRCARCRIPSRAALQACHSGFGEEAEAVD